MKIRRIVATEVIVPAKPGTVDSEGVNKPLHMLPVGAKAGWSVQFDQLSKCILQLETDAGVVGLGETYRSFDWQQVSAMAECLVGLELESVCRQQLPVTFCREYDGFECAVWDAYARSIGVRVVDLLGGPVRDRVKVGAWTSHRHLSEIPDLAKKFHAAGYDCWKFKCDLEDPVVEWCQAIKDNAPGMQVILDPNQRWERPVEARKRIDALAEVGNVLCLEDPIPRWQLQEMADLRQYGPIAIVLHVALPYILQGQRIKDAIQAIQMRAVDGFNFNCGLANFQRLDAIASAAELQCWHGSEVDLGIMEAMYVHSVAAAASCVWPSDIFGRLVRSHDLLKEPLRLEAPHCYLPEGPGLGVELDTDALAEFTVSSRTFE